MRWKTLNYKSSKHYVAEAALERQSQSDASDEESSDEQEADLNPQVSQLNRQSSQQVVSNQSNNHLVNQEASNASDED